MAAPKRVYRVDQLGTVDEINRVLGLMSQEISELRSQIGDGSSSVGAHTLASHTQPYRIGTDSDHTLFESDGTMVFEGGATVYNDLALSPIVRVTGVNRPTLTNLRGSFINAYTYAVNDWGELEGTELLHGWKEGTPIEVHAHWALNGANDSTVRGVKWKMEWTWANMSQKGEHIVFPAAQTLSAEAFVPANAADRTHFYTSLGVITPTGGKIGAYLELSIQRVASTRTAPVSNPFLLAVGVHYQVDTVGSRTTASK